MASSRSRSPGVGWLVRLDRDDAYSWIDERMISRALAHLGIAPLDRFLKGDGEPHYLIPRARTETARTCGCGCRWG